LKLSNPMNTITRLSSAACRRQAFTFKVASFSSCGTGTTLPSNIVTVTKAAPKPSPNPELPPLGELEDDVEMEDMFQPGPSLGQVEWGGPTRGGSRPEPTRFGDWDRKGRCSDF
jgi:hypothetical protein